MSQLHPAYPEECDRLTRTLGEIDRRAERLRSHECDPSTAAYGLDIEELHSLHGASMNPYYMRLVLRYENGTEKDVCLSESVRDLSLPHTYVAGIGSPLRQLMHRNSRDQALTTGDGTVRRVHLCLRRQIGIEARQIRMLSDNLPLVTDGHAESEDLDAFAQLGQEYLLQQLSREASAQARSILSSISERQDELMSAPVDRLLVVNGAPGSGKTAIAYSRIPLLLHEERRGSGSLEEQRVAIFVPNRFMQTYLRGLLPRFGLSDVYQTTFEDWAMRVINRRGGRQITRVTDQAADVIFDRKAEKAQKQQAWRLARARGRSEMKQVLRHLVAGIIQERLKRWTVTVWAVRAGEPEPLTFKVALGGLSLLAEQFRDSTDRLPALRSALQAAALRAVQDELGQRQQALIDTELRHLNTLKLSAAEKEKSVQATRRWSYQDPQLPETISRELRSLTTWPSSWDAYLELVSGRKRVEDAVGRVLPGGAQYRDTVAALFRPARSDLDKAGNRPPEATDVTELPLVLALKILLEGSTANDPELQRRTDQGGRFQYLVVDEGQDLSPLQYDLLANYTRPGHAAVFGDLRQGIHGYRGLQDWQPVIRALGTGTEEVQQLYQTFRSSQEITERANLILAATRSGQPQAEALPRPGSPIHFVRYGGEPSLVPLLAHEIHRLTQAGARNIGVITRSPEEARRLAARIEQRKAFVVDSGTRDFEQYTGGVAVVPISVAKGLEFDAAIVMGADLETYSPGTPYDGPLLYTCVSRALHHLTIFARGEFTPLLGELPTPEPGRCPISGLSIDKRGFFLPPPQQQTGGRIRKRGQERGPGANQINHVRTYDGRFSSMPQYEGDGSPDNPWYDY